MVSGRMMHSEMDQAGVKARDTGKVRKHRAHSAEFPGPPASFSRGGRRIFPLPYYACPPRKRGVCRAVKKRRCKIRCLIQNCNEAVQSMNWLAGFRDEVSNTCSPMQEWVLTRMEGLILDQEPNGVIDSQEEALRSLLHGVAPYEGGGAKLSLAPYRSELVSIPESVKECPFLCDILGESDRQFLEEESELMKRTEDELEGIEPTARPYWDPVLRYNRKEYNKLVQRLTDIHFFNFTTQPKCQISVFFVWKSNKTKLRMITDARCANRLFKDAPPVSLMTSEGLGRVELEMGVAALEDTSLFDHLVVHLGLSDVKDCFHRMRVPRWLSRYFCWEAVPAKVVGLTGETVDGKTLGPLDPVWPCAGSLCQGFSWSLYFAQKANEQMCKSVDLLREASLVHDRGPPVVLRVGQVDQSTETHYYVYVDNLGVLHFDQQLVANALKALQKAFDGAGLVLHGSEVSSGGTVALGTLIEGNRLRTRLNPTRMWRLHHAIHGLLQRQRCSGRSLEVLVGHCTFCGLMNRRSLSCFHTVYKFIQRHYDEAAVIWHSVREELQAFCGCLFLLVQSWDRQWNELVSSSDASLSGYGICHSWWPREKVAEAGRRLERTRFKRVSSHKARESALQAAGFTQDLGQWVPTQRITLDRLADEGWEVDHSFPEVPSAGLRREMWKPVLWGKWSHPEGILLLEARTVLKSLMRIAHTRYGHSIRQLVLCDNMSVVLSVERSRTKNFRLLKVLRRIAAYCFCRNIHLAIRWIPSELNISDEPSRMFEPGDSNLLVDLLGDSWFEGGKVAHHTSHGAQAHTALAASEQSLRQGHPDKTEVSEAGVELEEGEPAARVADKCEEREDPGHSDTGSESFERKEGPDKTFAEHSCRVDQLGEELQGQEVTRRPPSSVRRREQWWKHFIRAEGRKLRRQNSKASKETKGASQRVCQCDHGACAVRDDTPGDGCSHQTCQVQLPEKVGGLHGVCSRPQVPPRKGRRDGFSPGDLLQPQVFGGGGFLCGGLHSSCAVRSGPELREVGASQDSPCMEVFEGLEKTLPVKIETGIPTGCMVRNLVAHGGLGTSAEGNFQPCAVEFISPAKHSPSVEKDGIGQAHSGHHQVLELSHFLVRDERCVKNRDKRRLNLAGLLVDDLHSPIVGRTGPGQKDGQSLDFQLQRVPDSFSGSLRSVEAGCGALPSTSLGTVNRPSGEQSDTRRSEETRWVDVEDERSSLRKGGEVGCDLAEARSGHPTMLQSGREAHRRHHPRPGVSAHLAPLRDRKSNRFLADLFSGSGGVARAAQTLGFLTKEWDVVHGPAYDLTDRRVIFKIREDIRRGRIVAVMLAPPCSSFSPARDRTSVIRTRSSPWGLPGLSEKDQQKVEQGNSCIKAALEIIGDLNKYTIPWILENPHCSKMWFLPPLQKLVNDASVHVRVCDFCQFGTKWRKRTRFLIGNCDETDSLRLQRTCQAKNGHCSRSGKKHFHLTGSNNKGTPWTLIAQPYPSRLCHSLAHTLLSQAIEQRTH